MTSGGFLIAAAVAAFLLLGSVAAYSGWSVPGFGDEDDIVTSRAVGQPTAEASNLAAPPRKRDADRTPPRDGADRTDRSPGRANDSGTGDGPGSGDPGAGSNPTTGGGGGEPDAPTGGPGPGGSGGPAPAPTPPAPAPAPAPADTVVDAVDQTVDAVDNVTGGAVSAGGVTGVVDAVAPVAGSGGPVGGVVNSAANAAGSVTGAVGLGK